MEQNRSHTEWQCLLEKARECFYCQGSQKSSPASHDLFELALSDLDVYHSSLEFRINSIVKEKSEIQRSRNLFACCFDQAPIAYFILSLGGYVEEMNQIALEYWGHQISRHKKIEFSDLLEPNDVSEFMRTLESIKSTKERKTIELRCRRHDGSTFWGRFDFIQPKIQSRVGYILCSITDISRKMIMDEAISKLTVELSSVTGMGFFTKLLHFLISFPEVDTAVLSEFKKPTHFQSLAIASHIPIAEKITYSREQILSLMTQGKVDKNIFEPRIGMEGNFLDSFGLQDGMSVFLCDSHQQISGELSIFSRASFQNLENKASLLKIVSVRAAAELDRIKVEQQLIDYQDKLEFQVKKRTLDLERKTEEFRRSNVQLEAEIKARQIIESSLNDAKLKAEEAAKAKSAFLANMSHEIRTPLNGIIGLTSLFRVEDLSDLNRRYLEQIRSSGQSLLRIINDILDFSKLESDNLLCESYAFNLREVVSSIFACQSSIARKNDIYFVLDYPYGLPEIVTSDPVRIRQILENLINNALKFTEKGYVIVRIRVLESGKVLSCEVEDSGIGLNNAQKASIFERFYQGDSSTTRKYGGTGLGLAICQKIARLLQGQVVFESEEGKGSKFTFMATLPMGAVIENAHFEANKSMAVILYLECQVVKIALESVLRSLGVYIFDPTSPPDRAKIESFLRKYSKTLIIADDLSCVPEYWNSYASNVYMLLFKKLNSAQKVNWKSVANLPKVILIEKTLEDLGILAKEVFLNEHALAPEITPSKTWKILLAEDNPINCEVAKGMLESLGMQVSVAYDGQEAFNLFMKEHFELVLMDCLMPVMDGFEALQKIRSSPRPDVFVVALTANAMVGDREKCLDAGFDEYLSKPIEMKDIKKLIAKIEQKVDSQETRRL